MAEYGWTLDAERAAEGRGVDGHLLDRAALDGQPDGAALAALVEVDELGRAVQGCRRRLEICVVEAGTSVQKEYDRAFAHGRALRDQGRPFHIEVQLGVIDG